MSKATVCISEASQRILQELADQTGQTLAEVLDKARAHQGQQLGRLRQQVQHIEVGFEQLHDAGPADFNRYFFTCVSENCLVDAGDRGRADGDRVKGRKNLF